MHKPIYAKRTSNRSFNVQTIIIKNTKILKFPNVNYNISNTPYHEIIDTAY